MSWYLECGTNSLFFSSANFVINDVEIELVLKHAGLNQLWLVCCDDFDFTIQESALCKLAEFGHSLFLDLFPEESEIDKHISNYSGSRRIGGALRDLDEVVQWASNNRQKKKDLLHIVIATKSGQNPMVLSAVGSLLACRVVTAIQITSLGSCEN